MLHLFLLVSFCFLSLLRLTNESKKSLLAAQLVRENGRDSKVLRSVGEHVTWNSEAQVSSDSVPVCEKSAYAIFTREFGCVEPGVWHHDCHHLVFFFFFLGQRIWEGGAALSSILLWMGRSFTKWTSCCIEEDLKLETEAMNASGNCLVSHKSRSFSHKLTYNLTTFGKISPAKYKNVIKIKIMHTI